MQPNDGMDAGSLQYLPVFFDVRDKPVLVLGGSDAAAAKVRLLLRAGARVRLIAPHAAPEMHRLIREGRIAERLPAFSADALIGVRLAFDDGEDPEASERLALAAPAFGVAVNCIDRPEGCDFIIPAVIDRSPVVVAVGTGGASPTLAKIIRQRIESVLPQGLGRLTTGVAAFRDRLKAVVPTARGRMRFWDRCLSDSGLERLCAVAGQEDGLGLSGYLEAALPEIGTDGAVAAVAVGSVSLVGAGPGDATALSLEAAQALRSADVVLHDALVSPEVLAMVRAEARVMSVGKRAGRPSMAQDLIHRLMVTHARRGDHVVRLKGGDPFVFGRGGEECAALAEVGIPVRTVAGQTAAFGVAHALGIPLTHRGEARSVRLATVSFRAGDGGAPDWAGLADAETTLCLYMAGRDMDASARALMAAGLDGGTPTVLVRNGTRADQSEVFGCLADMACSTVGVGDLPGDGPVLAIIGAVVAHAPGYAARSTEFEAAPIPQTAMV